MKISTRGSIGFGGAVCIQSLSLTVDQSDLWSPTQRKESLEKVSLLLMNRSSEASKDPIRLPISYVPSDNDVIIGPGGEAKNHVGNRNLFIILRKFSAAYSKSNKIEKGRIISQIIYEATELSPMKTPFVKFQNGYWYAVEGELAREKVSQTMRNLLHAQYRSSAASKKQRRVQNYRLFDSLVHSIMKKKGNFISARLENLYGQMERNRQRTDDEVLEAFTQANSDILESLKSLSLRSNAEMRGVSVEEA